MSRGGKFEGSLLSERVVAMQVMSGEGVQQ